MQLAEELKRFGSRIREVGGRRGLNAFSNTTCGALLAKRGMVDVVLAGVGRLQHGRGWFVQDLFCTRNFPLYADVITSDELLTVLDEPTGDSS